jgi:hypothetical protein
VILSRNSSLNRVVTASCSWTFLNDQRQSPAATHKLSEADSRFRFSRTTHCDLPRQFPPELVLDCVEAPAPAQRKRPSPCIAIRPQRRTHFETSHLKQGRSPVDPRRHASLSSRHRLHALAAFAGTAARECEGPDGTAADPGGSALMVGTVGVQKGRQVCDEHRSTSGQLGGGNKQIGAMRERAGGSGEGFTRGFSRNTGEDSTCADGLALDALRGTCSCTIHVSRICTIPSAVQGSRNTAARCDERATNPE